RVIQALNIRLDDLALDRCQTRFRRQVAWQWWWIIASIHRERNLQSCIARIAEPLREANDRRLRRVRAIGQLSYRQIDNLLRVSEDVISDLALGFAQAWYQRHQARKCAGGARMSGRRCWRITHEGNLHQEIQLTRKASP